MRESKCQNKEWGQCCCNCRFQEPIYKHPSNETLKGPISEVGGYICHGSKCEGGYAIFMDYEHSMCELHSFKISISKEEQDKLEEDRDPIYTMKRIKQ